MSNKGNVLQSSIPSSPLRGNTFVKTSNVTRNGVNKNSKSKEELSIASALNFELVGSPAPRSQVRALVSSVPKYKPKHSQNSRVRDQQNDQDSSMEKFYQFVDNPTKFVCSENQKEKELKLDLAFSDRSGEESDNFYNSHNIAFGENGVYRIPEYDHIRYLEFNVSEKQVRENSSADEKVTGSLISGETVTNMAASNDEDESMESSKLSTVETNAIATPRKDETSPWYPKNRLFNYPLGSATNYKKNINPMVEKFMLDTGPESLMEKYTPRGNPPRVDDNVVVKDVADTLRWRSYESLENSSKSSPRTSQTTLTSESDGLSSREGGTWHEHSLNSPYFGGSEEDWGNLKERAKNDPEREIEEYLTIVREEKSCSSGVQKNGETVKYILMSDELFEWECEKNEEKSTLRMFDGEEKEFRGDESKSSVYEEKDTSGSDESTDYCIKDLFPPSSSSRTDVSSRESETRRGNFSISRENIANKEDTKSGGKTLRETPRNYYRGSNGVFITPEELTSAAEYANKLSEILNRVRNRSASITNKNYLERLKIVQSQNTPRLITECLQSSNFQANPST